MLQSGLHRRPFIGANVDGIGQLIKDGNNGLLFKSGDSGELAEKIRLFKSDKFLADSCAHKLSDYVKNNYTQNTIIPKIAALYDRLSHQQNY
jgi:glycosyltransferase involved in cell wall biosynthesis